MAMCKVQVLYGWHNARNEAAIQNILSELGETVTVNSTDINPSEIVK